MAWPTTHKIHNRFWTQFSTHCLQQFGRDGMCDGGWFSNRSKPSEARPTDLRWVGAGNNLFWWLYSMCGNWHKTEVSHLSFWWKEWVFHVRIMRVKWSWCLGAHRGIPKGFSIPRLRVGRSGVEEFFTILKGDLEIIWSVGSWGVGFGFTEDIRKVVIVFKDIQQIY